MAIPYKFPLIPSVMRGFALLSASLAILVFAAPAGAATVEGKPLKFTKFTLQPTRETIEESFTAPSGYSGVRFINEPYAHPYTQAGGHPWGLTAAGEFETEPTSYGRTLGSRDVKDVITDLPAGLLGDPMAVPRCSLTFVTGSAGGGCPADTQLGVFRVKIGVGEVVGPIVNVVPEAGQSAEFALEGAAEKVGIPLLTAHLVRTTEGYSFAVDSNSIPNIDLQAFELTFWGVPADSSHNAMRGKICLAPNSNGPNEPFSCIGGEESAGIAPVPFLTMSSNCTAGPETATIRADSWEEPGSVGGEGYTETQATLPAATGCDVLQFNAGTGIGLEPDTTLADEPVGLGVNLHVPQNEKPQQNAAPLLRETSVTLPEGMSVSPGVVDGIEACNATGPEGINITGPESEQKAPSGELQLAPGHCPDASIVGEAEAITPFLPNPVKGHVYLARPGCGGAGQAPCTEQDAVDGNLYKLYLELGGTGALSDAGIVFKVPLNTQANPATGQLTATATGLVQAPYSEVQIRLNGGPRAPLDNPPTCNPAATTADFTPWSAPGFTPEGQLVPGTPDALSSSYFEVKGCSNPPAFKPGFVAGTVIPQAAKFSAFTMNLSRQDREQYVKGIQVHTPAGLLGMLSSVPLCEEPLASNGHCPETAKIGTTTVASGAGSHPFEISGNVYLTKGYDGAPFGLSIVTNAVAGPFNLGLVVVRARIQVDPETSELTITTDETGPYKIPQIIFGVPLRLQRITVNVDRPGFMFNPTSCAAKQITATVSGNQNTTATVSSPFAAGGCQSLAFKPKFTVSTSGHTSRPKGASLDAVVSYPAGSVGNETNIAHVKVSLPKQLPSRLTTLQKACLSATFNRNPAECPVGSIVGIARATTPLLPVGLAGPVYFVSHGGEQFPSLIVVLQGDGVRVDLTGTTFINKAGITSSTFKTVPDVPVGRFELYLPEGKYSALAANGKLCKLQGKLKMPTEFVAQNGAVIKKSTNISVTGCAKAKKKGKKGTRAHKARTLSHGDRRTGR